ncbi:MAG TPA: type IV pilus assembly protein PilM [Gaiellaceae bacterium]|nr:type IV pilus assembly protein PilM [Gaiellaceae bacterium]
MDLKQEIKLSDLFGRKGEGAGKAKAPKKNQGKKKVAAHGPSEYVGLEIGSSQIAAAHVTNNGERKLHKLHREPLPAGIMASGEVRDPVALGAALASFFEKYELPKKNVRLGLANTRVGVRLIEIAGVDDESQLANAIGFRANELLSIPIDEAVMDYHVVGEERDEEGTVNRSVVVAIAYRESLERYLTATDAAGLGVSGIDLEAFALLRAITEPRLESDPARAAVVAVCIGHERTTLAVSDGRICSFARVIDWGGFNLTNVISRALRISPAEAEDVKRRLSLEPDAELPEGLEPEQATEGARAVKSELQSLVRELLSSLRFYQSQSNSLDIGEILVSGGTTSIPGLVDELQRELGVKMIVGDPLRRVTGFEDAPEQIGSFAVAIGLGIED